MGKLFPGAVIEEAPSTIAPPVVPPVAAPAPATPPAPLAAQPPIPPPVPTPGLTAEAIRTAVRDGVREAAPAVAPAPAPPTLDLLEEDADTLKALRFMESIGQVTKGKADEFFNYIKAYYEYQDVWLKENPGEQMDLEKSPHAEWIAERMPDLPDQAKINKALLRLQIDEGAEQLFKTKYQPEIERQQAERAWAEAQPTVTANVNRRVLSMVEQVNPELAKLVKDDRGNPKFTTESTTALAESDPVADEEMKLALWGTKERPEDGLLMTLDELEKFNVLGDKAPINPRDPVHARIMSTWTAMENEMSRATDDVRIQDGRAFCTRKQWNAMSREEREKHFTFTPADVGEIIVSETADRITRNVKRFQDLEAKKNKRIQPNPPPPPLETAQPPPPPPPPAAVQPALLPGQKPRSPSISSANDVVTAGNPAGGGTKTLGQEITDVMFRK